MKRIFFLALFVVMYITTFAQEDYHPLVTNGKYWKGKEIGGNHILQNNDDTPGLQFEYDVFLQGDTVINGVSYLKCYKIEERGTNGNSPSYYRALREEGRKVYGLSNGSEEERLMFDFNMQEGDVVYCKWEGGHESFLIEGDMNESQEQVIRTMKLERIDMYTNTEGLALRRYHFTTNVKEKMDDGSIMEYESLPTVWVEGIGSQNDYPLNSWHVDLVSSYGFYLEKCYDLLLVYFSSSPNNVKETEVNNPNVGPIYDLLGRRLHDKPAKGIYIQNGRKFVVK